MNSPCPQCKCSKPDAVWVFLYVPKPKIRRQSITADLIRSAQKNAQNFASPGLDGINNYRRTSFQVATGIMPEFSVLC